MPEHLLEGYSLDCLHFSGYFSSPHLILKKVFYHPGESCQVFLHPFSDLAGLLYLCLGSINKDGTYCNKITLATKNQPTFKN